MSRLTCSFFILYNSSISLNTELRILESTYSFPNISAQKSIYSPPFWGGAGGEAVGAVGQLFYKRS